MSNVFFIIVSPEKSEGSIEWLKQYGDVLVTDRKKINNVLKNLKSEIDKVIILDGIIPPQQGIDRILGELEENDIVCMKTRTKKGFLARIVSKIYSIEAKLMMAKDGEIKNLYPVIGFKSTVLKECGKIYYPCILQSIFSVNENFKIKIIEYSDVVYGISLKKEIFAIWAMLSIGRQTGEFYRIFKFALVGISGIFVNEFFLWFLTENFGLFYLISSIFAIELSIISNFTLNDFWTFRDRRKKGVGNTLSRLLKYNVISWSTGSINWIILAILNEFLGVYYLIANLCGIFAAFVGNFILSSIWAWKK